jgi:hypothetical protein
VERRVVSGVGFAWEPPPPEVLEAAGAAWELRVEPFSWPFLDRLTAKAVEAYGKAHPGARLIDLAELPIGGRDATRVLLHVPLPEGPACVEQWRVDAGGLVALAEGRCPAGAYDAVADAFATAAASVRVLL